MIKSLYRPTCTIGTFQKKPGGPLRVRVPARSGSGRRVGGVRVVVGTWVVGNGVVGGNG